MQTLSIIVPTYNEERTIASVIEDLLRLQLHDIRTHIIVVNDGSTDATETVLKPFQSQVVSICHDSNRGKGAAIRTGLSEAAGDFVLIQDGDLEYSPKDIPALLDALRAHPHVAAVYGSRNLAPAERGYGAYILGVWFLTMSVNLLFHSRLTDVYTCYKLIRTPLLKSLDLRANGFEIEMEITAKLLKNGLCIREIPISYRPRSFCEGKKIRAVDGLKGVSTLCRVIFS